MKIYNVTLEACLEIEAENAARAISLSRAIFNCDAGALLRPAYVWANEYKTTWSDKDSGLRAREWFEKLVEDKLKQESQEETPF